MAMEKMVRIQSFRRICSGARVGLLYGSIISGDASRRLFCSGASPWDLPPNLKPADLKPSQDEELAMLQSDVIKLRRRTKRLHDQVRDRLFTLEDGHFDLLRKRMPHGEIFGYTRAYKLKMEWENYGMRDLLLLSFQLIIFLTPGFILVSPRLREIFKS